ncbi:MAG: tetratricopeptide repeat protein [Candidatus Omnitrophica bacterium]|nr:tetratricopeptide repeat protein [Candidatus Omnitrophota bacterium]
MILPAFNFVKKHSTVFSLALIIVTGISIYFNSLGGQFIWDDHLLIRENVYLESWANLPEIFSRGITSGSGVIEGSFYRPLQIFSYLLNYSLWGINPGGYHLVNIILHVLVAICVYWLSYSLFADKILALLAGVFFVACPIHTEAVTYISGRADSLVAVFMLFSLIYYIRFSGIESPKVYFIILFSYICALLSKENSLIFPAIILFYHYAFRKKISIGKISAILAVSVFYIILRFMIFDNLMPKIEAKGSILERIPGFFAGIAGYVRLMFFPFNLHMEYGNKLFSLFDPAVILGILISALLIGVAFLVRKTNKIIFFGVGWFFLMLMPMANIYRVNASYMMEHWLYLPSIGFFLMLAGGLSFLFKKKNFQLPCAMVVIALILFYSFLTIKQNDYWSDEITFYERTLEYKPANPKIYFNLGLAYDKEGRRRDAIEAYEGALAINPNYFLAHNNLAVAYYEEKKYDLAIKHCDRALALGYPVHPEFLERLKPYRAN